MRRCIAYDSYDWNPPMRQNKGTVTSQSSARTHRRRAGIELGARKPPRVAAARTWRSAVICWSCDGESGYAAGRRLRDSRDRG
jgi:hypothetical protein